VSYLLDNSANQAGDRFGALSATFDGWTRRRLDALGLAAGWDCWEVGAGGPSLPTWLAERVGPTGRVVASDLDVSWIAEGAPFEVLQADVAADAAPAGAFDLVHARLVLTHIPRRDEALRRMAAALRPGGWLVIEDFDVSVQPRACPDAATAEEDRANRVREGFVELLVQRGVDLTLGRTLRRRLLGLQLTDVGAEAYAPLALPATRQLEIANTLQVADGLRALGLGGDVAGHLDALQQGRIDVATPPLVTAWGRRPG
jgi:SAM-dependent methyltransferase